jgi:hypothetical protein
MKIFSENNLALMTDFANLISGFKNSIQRIISAYVSTDIQRFAQTIYESKSKSFCQTKSEKLARK